MTSLAERTVLVTGANRGMGREYVAQLLGRKVAKVYAATRNPLAIDVSDPRVIPLQLDVTDAVSVAEAADLATDVGILINNAGISRASSVLDKDTSSFAASWRRTCSTARAGLRVRRPHRREIRCHRQRFLGTRLASLGMSYGVSKAAMWSATESMRIELAPRGVQVVGVYVGLVDTDMGRFADAPKSDPADVVRQVLDGIEAGKEDVLADEMSRQVRASLNVPARERIARLMGN